jgi:hypothetical protein
MQEMLSWCRYGFYCRPDLLKIYGTASVVVGVLGLFVSAFALLSDKIELSRLASMGKGSFRPFFQLSELTRYNRSGLMKGWCTSPNQILSDPRI